MKNRALQIKPPMQISKEQLKILGHLISPLGMGKTSLYLNQKQDTTEESECPVFFVSRHIPFDAL